MREYSRTYSVIRVRQIHRTCCTHTHTHAWTRARIRTCINTHTRICSSTSWFRLQIQRCNSATWSYVNSRGFSDGYADTRRTVPPSYVSLHKFVAHRDSSVSKQSRTGLSWFWLQAQWRRCRRENTGNAEISAQGGNNNGTREFQYVHFFGDRELFRWNR